MRPGETLHDVHEYGCGRGMFYDLDCGCWDGPRVTEADLREREAGLEAKPRIKPLVVSKAYMATSSPASPRRAEE